MSHLCSTQANEHSTSATKSTKHSYLSDQACHDSLSSVIKYIYIYNCVSCESCWTETCWQLRLRSGHWNWQKLASNGFKTSRCQTASVLDVICHPIRIGKELMSDTQSTIVKQSFNARCQTTRVGTKLLSEMPSKSARLKPQGSEKQSGSVKECNNEFDVRN